MDKVLYTPIMKSILIYFVVLGVGCSFFHKADSGIENSSFIDRSWFIKKYSIEELDAKFKAEIIQWVKGNPSSIRGIYGNDEVDELIRKGIVLNGVKKGLYVPDHQIENLPSQREWLNFQKSFKEGDEIWYFKSPPESWEGLHGREGYVILRDNIAVDEYVTLMN
tara:strand:- start:49 stop:543 length:495 start_codon:yes stop_codon:yes gene_type:complete